MGLCIRYPVSFKLEVSTLGLGVDFYSTEKLSLPVNVSWLLAEDIRLTGQSKGLITDGTASCVSIIIFTPVFFAPSFKGYRIWPRWILCKQWVCIADDPFMELEESTTFRASSKETFSFPGDNKHDLIS